MYDGTYYVDLTYTSNLPEAIPAALQQQTTRLVGDNFYAMLAYSPSRTGIDDAALQATYINMYNSIHPHSNDFRNRFCL